MSNIQPVTKSSYAGKRWQRRTSYAFAASDSLVPLVNQELPKALFSLPVGFIFRDKQAFPVAVLGFRPGRNLLVSTEGRWLGSYVPAAYRAYPFSLAKTDDGRQILCIDEDSGLVSTTKGEPFFTEEGEPTREINQILDFLTKVESNRQATMRMCEILQHHELIQPWPIKIRSEEGEKPLTGLCRIDENRLNKLDRDSLDQVRQAGALPLIYCQLLSMGNLQMLAGLAKQAEGKTDKRESVEAPDLNSLFGSEDDMFRFE